MSFWTELVRYTDRNGLAANAPVPPDVLQGSDNGPGFESEKLSIMVLRNEASGYDKTLWAAKISACIRPEGLLCRVPYHTIQLGQCPNTQFPPDDVYAICNAAQKAGNTGIPRAVLKGAAKHWGFMNNVNPGVKTGQSFLLRQIQLIACLVSAAYPSWTHPGHILARTLAAPFYLWAGLVLAVSCIGEPVQSTDPRRLAWHLWHATRRHSLAVRLGGWLWYKRLKRDYAFATWTDGNAMRAVAGIYYKPPGDNPYAKYWID